MRAPGWPPAPRPAQWRAAAGLERASSGLPPASSSSPEAPGREPLQLHWRTAGSWDGEPEVGDGNADLQAPTSPGLLAYLPPATARDPPGYQGQQGGAAKVEHGQSCRRCCRHVARRAAHPSGAGWRAGSRQLGGQRLRPHPRRASGPMRICAAFARQGFAPETRRWRRQSTCSQEGDKPLEKKQAMGPGALQGGSDAGRRN